MENKVDEDNVNKEVEQVKDKYPSAKVLLDLILKENDRVYDVKKQFEGRAAVLIAFSGVLLVFFSNKIDVNKLIASQCTIILLITFLFVFMLSMKEFIEVIKTRGYKGFDVNLLNETLAEREEKTTSLILVKTYVKIIESYNIENEEKRRHFEKGIKYLTVSVFLLVLMFILPLIIV